MSTPLPGYLKDAGGIVDFDYLSAPLTTAGVVRYPAAASYYRNLGYKEYELTNHLGNVLATILDRRLGVKNSVGDTVFSYVEADVKTAQYYYPFGSPMPGRTYVAPTGAGYRFGFNGMQRDDEIKGPGNSFDFGARMYDSRLGRWMSVDRLASIQPESSTYKSMNNNPLIFIDPDGNTEYLVINIQNQQTGKTHTIIQVMDKDKVKEKQNWWLQGSTSVYNYSYHDIYKTQNITIAKNGDVSVSKIEETYSKANYIRHPLLRFVPEIPEFSLSGKGGVQKGGIYLTSNDGGIDPTKFKSLSSVEHRDITSLLGSLSAIGKARSLVGELSLGSPVADVLESAASLATDVADRVFTETSKPNSKDSVICNNCKQKVAIKDMVYPHDVNQLKNDN